MSSGDAPAERDASTTLAKVTAFGAGADCSRSRTITCSLHGNHSLAYGHFTRQELCSSASQQTDEVCNAWLEAFRYP